MYNFYRIVVCISGAKFCVYVLIIYFVWANLLLCVTIIAYILKFFGREHYVKYRTF